MNTSKTLIAALCLGALSSPAWAESGAALLSDAEMENVVAGETVQLHVTGSGKVLVVQGNGPAKLLAGTGPDNKGVRSFHATLETGNDLQIQDGTLVGNPSGNPKGFMTIETIVNWNGSGGDIN